MSTNEIKQDEIIRMAREAGLIQYVQVEKTCVSNALERFADLVVAHEAKEHLKMLENLREETKAHCLQGMAEAYEMGKQDEREACAKVCEQIDTAAFGSERPAPNDCAAAIRSRGEK